jgi:hypothetical protein
VPTQLQLEGADLESLLTRVKTELGHSARIVRAEKVRTGGIAGFFAKQRFEISVEVGDEPTQAPAAAPAPAPAPPASLLELADRISDTENAELSVRERVEATTVPVAAPSGRTFAAVLAGFDSTTGISPTSIPPVPTTAPVPAAPQVTSSPTVPPVRPQPVFSDAAASVSTEGSGFAALLANLDATAGAGDDKAVAVAPTQAAPQFLEPVASAPAVVLPIPAARTPESPVVAAPVFAAPVALPVHQPFGRAPGHHTLSGQLVRLGLPAHLLPYDTEAPVYPTLLKSLRALPKAPAPANRAGAVLAVVGPQQQALETARMLARELELPLASSVVLATARRVPTDVPERQVLRDIDQAEARRAAWRRRRSLTIVAIDAPMTAAGAVQARAYLAALEPTATWGAVEATRKPYDVGAFARAVGGFEALAISAVDETSDPAAVLELGIPVARLDAQPATPSAWAALLTGRLAA